jgi:hypothetical protein
LFTKSSHPFIRLLQDSTTLQTNTEQNANPQTTTEGQTTSEQNTNPQTEQSSNATNTTDYIKPLIEPDYNSTSIDNKLGTNNQTYKIYIVQDKLCPDDLPQKEYKDLLVLLIHNLRNTEHIFATLGQDKIKINTINVEYETEKPDVSDFTTSNTIFTKEGDFKLKVTTKSNLFCYWRIDNVFAKLDVRSVRYCSSDFCGYGPVKSNVLFIEMNVRKGFAQGSYALWMTCYQNIPNHSIASDVISLFKFNIIN